MKKIIILAFFAIVSQNIYAQQKLQFSVKYLPMQSYAMAVKMDMDMNMNIDDAATAKAMKDAGQPANMLMKMNMNMAADIATKGQDAKKDVPLVMTYNNIAIDASMNGQALPIPQTDIKGMAFLGHYSNQTKKISIDGVQGGVLDPAKKAAAEAQLSQMFNQYSFPDTTLKIGDTFEQSMPLSVPVGGASTEVMTKIKYTLKEIKGNDAIFDLDQALDMAMDLPQGAGKMTMKGSGKGSMVYDIAAKFPTQTNINMDFKFNMNSGGIPISGDMKGVSIVDVKITKK
jgi:hypothetical protein